MTGKIIIDTERCKGCQLCLSACIESCISVSTQSNSKGYFPPVFKDGKCIGCAVCAVVCPEVAIEVRRSSNIIAIEPTKVRKRDLVKEKV
jgi:2-oxoglutarate ferredoxin oxidoreductase subunit delta